MNFSRAFNWSKLSKKSIMCNGLTKYYVSVSVSNVLVQVLVLCSVLMRLQLDGGTTASLLTWLSRSSPPVLGYELDQVVGGDLVALLLEEGGEPRFSVQRSLVVFEHWPAVTRMDSEQIRHFWFFWFFTKLLDEKRWTLTWRTRQTACGTSPVCCKTACWVSITSEQSVIKMKKWRDTLTRRHSWYFYVGLP